MQLRTLVILLTAIISFSSIAMANTATRSTKADGGTAWENNEVLTAARLNGDIDSLITVVNTGLDNNNIKAGAGIVWSKIEATNLIFNEAINSSADIDPAKLDQTAAGIDADIVDDYSATEPEQATSSDPGTSENTDLAENLEEEIEQLRFKLEQIGIGTSTTDVASGSGTDTDASWIDGPYRPGNNIRNNGFDVWTTADCSPCASAGDGWNLDQTPDIAATQLTEADGEGHGQGLLVTSNGEAGEGVSQILDGLKADTRYLLRASVKPTAGDACKIRTSGADTNQLSITSVADGAFEVIAGTFETDSTPTNITLRLESVSDGDICLWDHVAIYEINTDPVPQGGLTVTYDTDAEAGAISAAGRAQLGSFEIAVRPPGPNYTITVNAQVSFVTSGAANLVICDIDENGAAKGKRASGDAVAGVITGFFNLHYVNVAPTPGTEYTYQIFCEETAASTATYNGGTYPAELYVRMEPGG